MPHGSAFILGACTERRDGIVRSPRFSGAEYVVRGWGNGGADNLAPVASKQKSKEEIQK